MAEIDKIREAEEIIESIATELRNLRSAAQMLDAAQQKTDAAVKASESVVETAGEFAIESGKLLEALYKLDFETKLNNIVLSVNELETLLERQLDRLGSSLEGLEKRNSEILGVAGSIKEDLESATNRLSSDVTARVEQLERRMIAEAESRAASTKQILMAIGGVGFLVIVTLILVLL
jgi:hypothetical protein